MQARVPRKHATYRNRTLQCKTRCGDTQPHKKGLSLKQDQGRPPGCAMFACAYRACSCADEQAACTQPRLHCAVRREPTEAQAFIQDASCADASGAKEHTVSPRSWRPTLQEQKVWSARGEAGAAARRGRRRAHGMASRLGPGRGRTPGWDVEPGEGRGKGSHRRSLALPAPAGKGSMAFSIACK